jgi:hypothetical protein
MLPGEERRNELRRVVDSYSMLPKGGIENDATIQGRIPDEDACEVRQSWARGQEQVAG